MTEFSKELIGKLSSENLIDGVGEEMILFADKIPSSDDIVETIRSYGLPVYITEFQVVMTNIHGTPEQRQIKQAEIYKNVTEAILNAGNSNTIIFFVQSDKVSPWKNEPDIFEYSKAAAPTLFDDNYQPKSAYYAVLQAFMEKGK